MLPEYVRRHLMSRCAVGSRATCNPPPTDTDEDWLGLVEETELATLEELLEDEGWTPAIGSDGNPYEGAMRISWKKVLDATVVNLILTTDMDHYNKFLALSSVAARLNLNNKADRVALFRAGLDGQSCTLPDGRHWTMLNGQTQEQAVTQATATEIVEELSLRPRPVDRRNDTFRNIYGGTRGQAGPVSPEPERYPPRYERFDRASSVPSWAGGPPENAGLVGSLEPMPGPYPPVDSDDAPAPRLPRGAGWDYANARMEQQIRETEEADRVAERAAMQGMSIQAVWLDETDRQAAEVGSQEFYDRHQNTPGQVSQM